MVCFSHACSPKWFRMRGALGAVHRTLHVKLLTATQALKMRMRIETLIKWWAVWAVGLDNIQCLTFSGRSPPCQIISKPTRADGEEDRMTAKRATSPEEARDVGENRRKSKETTNKRDIQNFHQVSATPNSAPQREQIVKHSIMPLHRKTVGVF